MLGSPSYLMGFHEPKTSIQSVFSVKTYRVRFFIILLEPQLGTLVENTRNARKSIVLYNSDGFSSIDLR